MFDEFHQAAAAIFQSAQQNGALVRNPDEARLRALALDEPEVRQTRYASLAVDSEPMSRAAKLTKNNIDTPFGPAEHELLEQAQRRLAQTQLVSIEVQVGDGTDGVTARLIVPRAFAHVAYGGVKLFVPTVTDNPTYQTIMFFDEEFEANRTKPLPQKSITIRLAHDGDGRLVKFVRNSNYFGEWKKGVFAGEDYRAKLHGDAIFLHAGCRKDTLETVQGPHATTYSLFVALSANGKTSTTCRVLARRGRERSWLIQDDGGTLHRDGRFRGFEAGGLFVKTDCLNPGEQFEAYYGCLKRHTFLENVCVTDRREHRLLRPLADLERPGGHRAAGLHPRRQRHQRPPSRQPLHHHPGEHHPGHRQAVPRAGGGLHGPGAVDGVVGRRPDPGRQDEERVLLRSVPGRRP